MYLLDSNVCIRLINENAGSKVAQRLGKLAPSDIRLCSVVKSELYYGACKSVRREENLAALHQFFSQFVSLPFDDQSALIAGQIRSQLDLLGAPIGANDLLIASIALANDRTLVTHNIREFSRVEGLKYEDWEQ